MRLWTHHPSTAHLDDPAFVIDPTKGIYWNHRDPTLRYRAILPILHKHLGTDQLLWCCTTRGEFIRTSQAIDLVEWEVSVPFNLITLYDVRVWDDLVWGRSENWRGLFVHGLTETTAACKEVSAIVQWPIPRSWLTCHGRLLL